MELLIISSAVWAVSFSLIKGNLQGVDPYFVSFIRLFLSFLVFIPFLSYKFLQNNRSKLLMLLGIGLVQYGVMYVSYIYAFKYLAAYEVALYTIFTPFFVILFSSLIERTLNFKFYLAAFMSIAGALAVVYAEKDYQPASIGFLLMQISNISFAVGQVLYKKYVDSKEKDYSFFSILYLGGLLFTIPFFISGINSGAVDFNLTTKQVLTLLYLGLIPSGACFYLWNLGAKRTNYGILATMNNLKIPLGVIFAYLILSEEMDEIKIAIGLVMIAVSVFVSIERKGKHISHTD